MAAANIGNIDTATSAFVYKGVMCVADAPSDYSTATLNALTNWKMVGETVGLSFDGDDASSESWTSDRGTVVTTTVTNGTLGWTVSIMSTSIAELTKWLNATALSSSNGTAFAHDNWAASATAYKMGDSKTQTVPFMFLNDEENRAFVFPKTKITTQLNMEDLNFVINMTISPESIETTNLSTSMVIEGTAYYEVTDASTAS